MNKERARRILMGPASIDWSGLLDPDDETERRRRVRQFQALLETFRSNQASREAPSHQLARQICTAAAQWCGPHSILDRR